VDFETIFAQLFQTTKSKRLSRTTHDMLAEIFKKIGSKENTREVSLQLYKPTRLSNTSQIKCLTDQ